jgi:glycosyltransferase involved in cell wall biosynthesis
MPRRILLLITDLEIGGTPTVVRELATRLNAPPEVVVEVAALGAGPVARQLRDAGIHVTEFGARSVYSLPRTVRSLRALLRDRGIDTVVSFLIHANAVAAIALRKEPGTRLFESIQTTQEKPSWHWWLQGRVQARAEQLVVPSHAIVQAAKSRSDIAADRFVVIPNAIEPGEFSRKPVFTGDVVRIGFLGRIDPVKRLEVAIAAMRELGDIPAELNVFGTGAGAGLLAGTLGIIDPGQGRLRWRGRAARPQDALGQMDVLILPSIGEGFGLVLIEALAAGVPVVASEAGAIPEVVRNEHTGLLVPVGPHEAAGFADAIRRLRADPAWRERIIANALADVRERFTWDVVLPQYKRLLSL